MELLDVLTVYYGSEARTIELYRGDLTNLAPQEAVDILVVSAFPNNYLPISGTLVGSLYRQGLSVEELAKNKAVDLRQSCSCWLSHELVAPPPGIQFKRILCFEPPIFGNVTEVIADIFRSLVPILSTAQPASVAMPLVSAGSRGESPSEIIDAILDAATHWMALGLPLKQLKIVEQAAARAGTLKQSFAQLKAAYAAQPLTQSPNYQYDVFISYAHRDSSESVQLIVDELQKHRPGLRIFLDRQTLNPGAAWQQAIYEALDSSRKVIAVYSPAYLKSKVCQEEFNIALYRHRNSAESIVFPILVYSAQLPTYMQMLQYADCREGDQERLRAACSTFLARLDS
jgi:O-acetyl-ADP-ribose deacetylase (regulator of RNase III)